MSSSKLPEAAPRKARKIDRRQALLLSGGALAAPFIASSAFAQAKTVNVGVIMPLSGANAQFGINSKNGVELVAEEINAAGGIKALGGAKINLVVADATSTPTTAANVAQRLLTQNEVVGLIGAFASSLTLAISEVAERRGVPLLTMSFADQITGRGFQHIYQVVAKASVLGKAQFDGTLALAAQAGGDKLSKIAIMYEDTAYGTAQATGIRAGAKAAGIEVVMDEAYPLGITDVTPLINKLRASGAQAAFPVSYLNDSLQIIRSMRQQGLTFPVIGGAAGYVIPDFEKGLGQYAEGVLSISPANYDQAPEYTSRFQKKYGYFMVHEAVEHAVCLDVLVKAIEQAKSTEPEALSKVLHGTRFEGGWCNAMTNGAVQFDATGLNTLSVPVMVQWRDKGLVTVWPDQFAKAKAVWKV